MFETQTGRGKGSYLLVAVLVLAVHAPALWRGRLGDDVYLLPRYAEQSWTTLIREGLTFPRSDFGHIWWAEGDPLARYFRPLSIATIRLVMDLGGDADWLHHAASLGFHLACAFLVLAVARQLFGDERSAIFAALLFALSPHTLLGAQWISGRKEILVALFILLALVFHSRRHTVWAIAAFTAALLSGEHAATFVVLVPAWDLVSPLESDDNIPPLRSRFRPAWLLYVAVLIVYGAIRWLALGSRTLPSPPYFFSPFAPGFMINAILNGVNFLASVTTNLPYMDLVKLHMAHRPILLIPVLLWAGILLAWLYRASGKRRLAVSMTALAFISWTPFIFFSALPFYLYLPSLFFVLAMGTVFDDVLALKKTARSRAQRLLVPFLGIFLVLSGIATSFVSWWPNRSQETIPSRFTPRLVKLLAKIPSEQKVLLVHVPNRAVVCLPNVARLAGRHPGDFALVTTYNASRPMAPPDVHYADPRTIIVEPRGVPYWATPYEKAVSFFPDSYAVTGLTVVRPWFTVEVLQVRHEKDTSPGGFRLSPWQPGVAKLVVRAEPSVRPPVVIVFHVLDPYIVESGQADY